VLTGEEKKESDGKDWGGLGKKTWQSRPIESKKLPLTRKKETSAFFLDEQP